MGATILRHNLTTIVTALVHSHPIAKELYLGAIIKNFSVITSQQIVYQVVFLFFVLTQNGAEKRKTTTELIQALISVASYKHPSQSIRQRCIAMRLARPTIAFLPLPVLCNSRLYI